MPSTVRRHLGVLTALLVVGATTLAGGPALADAKQVAVVTESPYHAAGDGMTNDRPAIQAAIDRVAERGGGTVVIPSGRTFLTGNLTLRSAVTLRVDGTLLQSQQDEHYTFTPTHGHLYPGGLAWAIGDLAMLHNDPLIYAKDASDVAVAGEGTIQLTRAQRSTPAESEKATIHVAAIGFYRVHDFAVRDVSMLGASEYTLALYTTRNGIVSGTRIESTTEDIGAGSGPNADGISIQNSQHLRITGNVVRSGDDGIYTWASYRDLRGGATSWWSSDDPQPTTDIEIDHNDVVARNMYGKPCCSGFSLIAWGGTDAPDQRLVQISDIDVHDNKFDALYPVRCWCDTPFDSSSGVAGQSPMTRVTLENNEYIPSPPTANPRGPVTSFETDSAFDYRQLAATSVMNGDFERTADAWWTTRGSAGATRAEQPAVADPLGRSLLAQADGWVGYVIGLPNKPASISQGIAPRTPADFPIDLGPAITYTLTADVATSGAPVRLVVEDRCRNTTLASRAVDATSWTKVQLTFEVSSPCGHVDVRLETGGTQPGWGLVDNIGLDSDPYGDAGYQVIDSTDPSVVKSGRWATYSGAEDVGGTHLVGLAEGANLQVSFTGKRAILIGIEDTNLGKADVYVDGVLHGVVDFYAMARVDGKPMYDTGELPAGEHVFELRTTGTKNTASRGIYTVFDALLAKA